MSNINPTKIYTQSEIAEIFELNPRFIAGYLASGELPGRKVGKRWFIVGRDLLDFVSTGNAPTPQRKTKPTPPKEKKADSFLETWVPDQAAEPASLPVSADQKKSAREQAVLQAVYDVGSSDQLTRDVLQRITDLLNERAESDGPKPLKGGSWSRETIRHIVRNLRQQKKL